MSEQSNKDALKPQERMKSFQEKIEHHGNEEALFNTAPPMILTYEQLKTHNGVINKTVYLALKGVIYDVSSSSFYAVGGGYHMFAGYDASINLAKMTHDEQYLNKYEEMTLDKDEADVLDAWIEMFNTKYPKVGKVLVQAK